MNKYEQIKGMANPNRGSVGVQEARPPQRTEQKPVKIAHRHEWFRTGEMKVGQMRCISCGTWGQEEIPQRTWVGLEAEEVQELRYKIDVTAHWTYDDFAQAIEARLKEKNT